MSISRALSYSPSVQCIIKQLLVSVFCDIQNNQGLGKGYQPKLKCASIELWLYRAGILKLATRMCRVKKIFF